MPDFPEKNSLPLIAYCETVWPSTWDLIEAIAKVETAVKCLEDAQLHHEEKVKATDSLWLLLQSLREKARNEILEPEPETMARALVEQAKRLMENGNGKF